nr:hypothetical protein [Methanobrevibacter arboriphilus]
MIIIKNMKVKSKFRYLWLKYILKTRLSVHCATCLVGEYSKHISPQLKSKENIILNEAPAKAYYLCGVASPYNWNKNFHLAFIEKEREIININENGIEICIENAKRIPITVDDIDWDYKHANKKEYNTCRNWQFAFTFNKMFNDIEESSQLNLDADYDNNH